MPAQADTLTLHKMTQSLRAAFGGPLFSPHLTVMGALPARADMLDEIAAFAQQHEAMRVPVIGPEGGDRYHRCVYLRVAASAALLALRQSVFEAFQVAPDAYLPHVSLLYADLCMAEQAAAVSMVTSWPSTIALTSLAVVETSGAAETWASVGEFVLAGNDR